MFQVIGVGHVTAKGFWHSGHIEGCPKCEPALPDRRLLPLGKLVATPGALELAEEHGINLMALVRRHERGDWGDLDPHDRRMNRAAVKQGNRVLSSYGVGPTKLWVITEADRSSTCILRPEDY